MKDRSRTEYAMLNIATGLGGYIVNTLLGFVCRMVFVRCLAAEYLGISGLFSNVLSMLSLAELGIGSAIVYALYKPLAENDEEKILSLVDFYRKAYMVIGIAVGCIGLILMPFIKLIIGTYTFKENIYVIYLLYLFNSTISYFFSYRSSLLQAAQRSYLVVGTSYVITILQSIFQMGFLILTRQYLPYLIIQCIGGVVYNLLISWIATKEYPVIKSKNVKSLEKEELKDITKNVWYLLTNRLANLLMGSTDNIITTYFQGIVTVGLASNYTLLTSTLNSLLSQLFNGLTGGVGNFNALKNEDDTERLLYSMNFANFWLFGLGTVGIICVSEDMVRVFFTDAYILDRSIPIVLAVNFYIVGMLNSVWIFKSALGQFKYGRYVVILTGLINIGLSILLGKIWGLFGIYLATIISRLLTNAWYEPYALFKYKLHRSVLPFFRRFLIYTLCLAIDIVICMAICDWINPGGIMSMAAHFIVVMVVTNGLFLLCFFRLPEFIFMKTKVIQVMQIAGRRFKH